MSDDDKAVSLVRDLPPASSDADARGTKRLKGEEGRSDDDEADDNGWREDGLLVPSTGCDVLDLHSRH